MGLERRRVKKRWTRKSQPPDFFCSPSGRFYSSQCLCVCVCVNPGQSAPKDDHLNSAQLRKQMALTPSLSSFSPHPIFIFFSSLSLSLRRRWAFNQETELIKARGRLLKLCFSFAADLQDQTHPLNPSHGDTGEVGRRTRRTRRFNRWRL